MNQGLNYLHVEIKYTNINIRINGVTDISNLHQQHPNTTEWRRQQTANYFIQLCPGKDNKRLCSQKLIFSP